MSGWTRGRAPSVLLISWLAALVILIVGWYIPVLGPEPWSKVDQPRPMAIIDALPVLVGTVGIYALTPRLSWLDMQSPRRIWLREALGAAFVIIAASVMGIIARLTWEVSNWFVHISPDIAAEYVWTNRDYLSPVALVATSATTTAAVIAITYATTAVIGPSVGPATSLLWLLGLYLLQGQYDFPLLQHGYRVEPLDWSDYVGTSAFVAVCIAVYVFRHRPLLRRPRHNA